MAALKLPFCSILCLFQWNQDFWSDLLWHLKPDSCSEINLWCAFPHALLSKRLKICTPTPGGLPGTMPLPTDPPGSALGAEPTLRTSHFWPGSDTSLLQSCGFLPCMTYRITRIILDTVFRCLPGLETRCWLLVWFLPANGNCISVLKSWGSADVCQLINCDTLLLLDCDLVTQTLLLRVQDEKYCCANYIKC